MVGALLGWWYGLGWRMQLRQAGRRWARWVDYFSFSTISRTLFAPFRQIGAGGSGGPLDVQFKQWADRTFSRAVGFVVRLFTLLFGSLVMTIIGLVSACQLVGWLLVPFLPVLGIIGSVTGWIPWQS